MKYKPFANATSATNLDFFQQLMMMQRVHYVVRVTFLKDMKTSFQKPIYEVNSPT